MYFSIYLLVFVVQLIEKYSGIAFTQLFADLRWCVLYKLIVGFFIDLIDGNLLISPRKCL